MKKREWLYLALYLIGFALLGASMILSMGH